MKPNKDEFGEEEMQRWWIEKDYLGVTGEVTLDAEMSEDEIVEKYTPTVIFDTLVWNGWRGRKYGNFEWPRRYE